MPALLGILSTYEYETFEIDRCEACKGIWLDQGELELILHVEIEKFPADFVRDTLRHARPGVPEKEQKSFEACPCCKKAMSPLNFNYGSGVIIDVCTEHGMWFDAKELEKIQAHWEDWEAKKGDVAAEFRGSLQNEKRDVERTQKEWDNRLGKMLPLVFRTLHRRVLKGRI